MNIFNKLLNRYLWLFIAGSCTAFVLTWLLFNWLIIPQVKVIIDRFSINSWIGDRIDNVVYLDDRDFAEN